MINKNIKMAEVIHMNHHLLPVINRFGIQLGFGDKTVEQVCYEHDVNPDFFTEIINAFNNKSYFPQKQLQKFPVDLIINYLKETHLFYINKQVPKIEALIDQMLKESALPASIQNAILSFFKEYKNELGTHIKYEEEVIYPYALNISSYYFNETNDLEKLKEISNYSIIEYRDDHDDIEEKLYDLKNIIIKYLPPQKDYELCNLILHELFELENDLSDHSRIEDLIMVPMIAAIEGEINKRIQKEG